MTDQTPEATIRQRYHGSTNAFHPGRYFRTNQSHPQRRLPDRIGAANHHRLHGASVGDNTRRPRVITIVKTGGKPRCSIKILLNYRSNQSYEQLIADISGAFGPNSKKNFIRKLFTARGKEVLGISDFFRGDDLFLAVGADEDLSESVLLEILDDFFPDTGVAKSLLSEWKKNDRKRRKIAPFNQFVKSNKEEHAVNQIDSINSNPVPDKRDSGFDSAEVSTNRSEPEHWDTSVVTPHKKIDLERRGFRGQDKNTLVGSQSETKHMHEFPSLRKVHEKRLVEENEENEKFNWRVKNITENERQIEVVDRRHKVLIPLRSIDHSSIKSDNSRVNEVDDRHVVKKNEVISEEQRLEVDAVPKDLPSNVASKGDDTIIERTNVQKDDKDDNSKCFHKTVIEDTNQVIETDTQTPKKSEHSVSQVNHNTETLSRLNKATDQSQNKEQEVIVSIETDPKCKLLPVDTSHFSTAGFVSGEQENKDKNNNQQQKEKRKQDRDDQQQRKRAKTKIVRKTKLERQVSSDEYILTQFELGRKLGDGNFAIVRQSRKIETGQEFAMKVIDKAKLKGKEHMVENEIDILKDCCHHNIVRLYEEYETSHRIYLVMELVKGGDLFDSITQNVRFRETDSSLMVKDVCNALFYLHSRSIVHRDLKPENLLVHRRKEGTISLKLADFGLAMEVTAPIYTVCGTPTYVAPEILADKGYGLEVDMWAVGVITYILLCGFPPFRSPDRNQTELFEFIKAGYFEFLSPYWDNISRHAKDLVSHLLVVDRKRRYNAVDVLSHKWIVCCGQTDVLPDGAVSIDAAARETRRELDGQAKVNYESYQRLKRKKKQELERKEE